MGTYSSRHYTSYAGVDIIASITLPHGAPCVFGELQTITYSIHRDKFPVRSLGTINPKGYTMGGRNIAGTLIFTVFDRHAILHAINYISSLTNDEKHDIINHIVTDEMPPFDVTIMMGNEYGNKSIMQIYGVTIVDEGQVMSVEDILTENTMSYLATGIRLLSPVDTFAK